MEQGTTWDVPTTIDGRWDVKIPTEGETTEKSKEHNLRLPIKVDLSDCSMRG